VDECKPLVRGDAAVTRGVRRRRGGGAGGGAAGAGGGGQGEAVQVDPIKPTLKTPGINRSKFNYDVLQSNVAFKFNLRCYIKAADHDEF
jgi:hypothetical protein